MKVLIIAPVADGMSNPKAYPPMGLYYVMAILNRYRPNWEVKICDMNHDKLLDYQYYVFLIGINIVQVLITKEIIKYIRRNNPHAYIILGGAMAPYLLNEYGSLGEDLIYSGEATKELISVLEKRTRRFYCATIKPQLRLGLPQIEEIVLKYNSYDQGAKSFSYIYIKNLSIKISLKKSGL